LLAVVVALAGTDLFKLVEQGEVHLESVVVVVELQVAEVLNRLVDQV
jgi:hypothetical protein